MRSGVVLLLTLVLLVVLSALGYTLSSRVAAQRHRNQYIIDYQAARYSCDSAVKYALSTLQGVNPQLISRPNEPDFSDLFHLSEEQYEGLLAEWAAQNTLNENTSDINKNPNIIQANDSNKANGIGNSVTGITDSNRSVIRGPYGPAWPLVTKPAELKIGSAAITIEIEDENAKYPISWGMLNSEEARREATAGLATFCEWMNIENEQADSLKKQLEKINEIKPFKMDAQPITAAASTPPSSASKRRAARTKSKNVVVPVSTQQSDLAKFFHSSLIDTEMLAAPTIISEKRKESAMKYVGMWASSKVNINTAPRQVLEAAFTFGGDADKIADEIIQRRRIKPFKDVDELKKSLFRYSDSIQKCATYITTVSDYFTIKVTAINGAASAWSVIAVIKNGQNIEKISMISG